MKTNQRNGEEGLSGKSVETEDKKGKGGTRKGKMDLEEKIQ